MNIIYRFYFCFRFEKSSKKHEGLHISHKVPKYQLYYEPFYVSLNNVPSYDERFIGYGYTRNSQVHFCS
jgi:N-acetyllactosaminide beta-1,3-N-acetylglucosaminyltransferase